MDPFVYLGLVFCCCLYFFGNAKHVKVEVLALAVMILVAPDILYKDIDNYILDTFKDLPFLVVLMDDTKLKLVFKVLYFFSYPICYFLFYKTTNASKEVRFLFFVFTFYTLALNQLYLCIAISFYMGSRLVNNKLLKLLFLGLGLQIHLSIFALFLFDIYRWKKPLGIALFVIGIIVFAISPNFYMALSGYDYRIEQLSAEGDQEWVSYTLRSQIYSYLCLFLFLFYYQFKEYIVFLLLIFLFSLAISSLHAVMVRRFIELFFIGLIYLVALHKGNKVKPSVFLSIVLTVFMIRSYFPYLITQ